jgi:DEAD/DEAH box helicase domain-containing protein
MEIPTCNLSHAPQQQVCLLIMMNCDSIFSFLLIASHPGNPLEHFQELIAVNHAKIIMRDASSSPEKTFIVWDPPFKDTRRPEQGRQSALMEVCNLVSYFVHKGHRVIAFCKTRKLCEIVCDKTQQILCLDNPRLAIKVCAYRSGYLASERRKIEASLFEDRSVAVISTNALELGIDIGHLDVVIQLGFPGSISSFRQQTGRAGRRDRDSLSILVLDPSPIDHHIRLDPRTLFENPPEICQMDIFNECLLLPHMQCASLEWPLDSDADRVFFGDGFSRLLKEDHFQRVGRDFVAVWTDLVPIWQKIQLRSTDTNRFQVYDVDSKELLEEMDPCRALFTVHDQAVYYHMGKTYMVEHFDGQKGFVLVKRKPLNYITRPRDSMEIGIFETSEYKYISDMMIGRGTVRVRYNVFGYYRLIPFEDKIIEKVDLKVSTVERILDGCWINGKQLFQVGFGSRTNGFAQYLHTSVYVCWTKEDPS